MGKISYFVKKKIGQETHQFSVEGENLFDVVMTSRNLSFGNVDKCGCCQSDDLTLSAHIAQKKFKYVTVKCKKCKATLNFGQQTENPEVFYLSTRDENGKKVLCVKLLRALYGTLKAALPFYQKSVKDLESKGLKVVQETKFPPPTLSLLYLLTCNFVNVLYYPPLG